MAAGTSHPGRITINTGTWTQDCTLENDLIANQAKRPVIREKMEYANRRSLTTLLVSGVVTPYGINNTEKTKIPEVSSKGKGIGNNGYQFSVMGRIEKASVILRQVGATQSDGRFQLVMFDRHLTPGMNAVFNGGGFVARVEGQPTGGPGNYLYNFWSPSGDAFSWATHVSGQQGTKTCMGAYTSYPEKSEKGYSTSKFADMFINHTTKQRNTVEISGDAASDILWYTFTADDGTEAKGWMYAQLKQNQAKFLYEDERQKFMGISTMKNSDGTLRSQAPVDNEGKALIAGDGLWEQIGGGNLFEGSGTNGEITIDDMEDIGNSLKLQGDVVSGNNFVWITGTRGFSNFQKQATANGINQNMTIFNQIEKDGRPGGPLAEIGYEFSKINLNGVSHIVCQHPFYDDELMWTERGADGHILKSSEYLIMDIGMGENVNMEILHKAGNGVNRQNVTAALNGLTGAPEMTISEEDAMKYAMLKEDMIVVYNTQKCAIARKVR